jgi:Metal-dependent hydrolase
VGAIELTVLTWNVLAAPWAAPGFYPQDMDPALLDRETRAELVATSLESLRADVLCLQETTPPDLAHVLQRLGDGYDHHAPPNGPDLWASWSTPEVPWEPNGTAIVWRREAFTDISTDRVMLTDDGNVAAVVRARRVGTGVPVRVVSVHLDADSPDLRRAQLPIALGALEPDERAIDVVAGDCNEDTGNSDLGTISDERGFRDALTELRCLDPTHPYARPSDDYAPLARLDHVLIRGAEPQRGWVIDSGVWGVDSPGSRLGEHLRRTGSDHLPVIVTVSR